MIFVFLNWLILFDASIVLRHTDTSQITGDLLTQSSMATIVFGTATAISTAGFTTTMAFTYGPQFNKIAFEGAVLGDFTAAEISPTPGDITSNLASVTESSPGVYDVLFTAPETSADVLELTYQKTTGVGFESVTNLSITIP